MESFAGLKGSDRLVRRFQALGQAAVRVQQGLTPDEVLATIGAQLESLGLSCFFSLLGDDRQALAIRYVSLSRGLALAIEQLLGGPIIGLRLVLDSSRALAMAVRDGFPTLVTEDTVVAQVQTLMPRLPLILARQVVRLAGVRTAIVAPLLVRSRVIGALCVWAPDITADDVPSIVVFAQQAATAYDNASLYESERQLRAEAEASRQELTALLAASREITASLDIATTLDHILDQVLRLSGADRARVWLLDPGAGVLGFKAGRGFRPELSRDVQFRLGEGLAGVAAQSGEVVSTPDVLRDPRWVRPAAGESIRASLQVPLKAGERMVGVLSAYSSEPAHFTPEHERLLVGLAEQAAMAIEHADQVERRERAQAELGRAERRFRTLSEQGFDVTAITTADGTVLYVDPGIERIFGYRPDDLIGKPGAEFIHPDDLRLLATLNADPDQPSGSRRTVEGRVRHRDGSWRLVEFTGANLLDDPAIGGFVVHFHDVTDQRRLEGELRQAQKMEAIGQLAAGVAHDFNNLLTIIVGNSELAILRLPAEHPARARIEEIAKAADRAASLTSQLLAFGRRQVFAPKVIELDEAIVGLGKMLRRLIGEDVELDVKPSGATTRVRVDPGQLEQVLFNLAVNARDAMPRGGTLTIATGTAELRDDDGHNRHDLPPGRYAVVRVADTGTGIDPDVLPHIFEPFFTTKGVGKGTGLGLATVFGIVTQSEGQIEVDSEPGRGTTFTIYLPLVESPGRPAGSPVYLARPGGSETILVVEDEDPVRLLVREILTTSGYSVLAAAGGDEALAIAGRHAGPIHLLIADVVMPGLSGREVAERLRQIRPTTRVMFISGYNQDVTIRHGVAAGDVVLLEKPFPASALLQQVRAVLEPLATPTASV